MYVTLPGQSEASVYSPCTVLTVSHSSVSKLPVTTNIKSSIPSTVNSKTSLRRIESVEDWRRADHFTLTRMIMLLFDPDPTMKFESPLSKDPSSAPFDITEMQNFPSIVEVNRGVGPMHFTLEARLPDAVISDDIQCFIEATDEHGNLLKPGGSPLDFMVYRVPGIPYVLDMTSIWSFYGTAVYRGGFFDFILRCRREPDGSGGQRQRFAIPMLAFVQKGIFGFKIFVTRVSDVKVVSSIGTFTFAPTINVIGA